MTHEAVWFVYDDGAQLYGKRDSSNSGTPINVKMYWIDDGFPELIDRQFTVVHKIWGHGNGWNVHNFMIASIDFVMQDNDPTIDEDSLRFADDPQSATNNLLGFMAGDEALVFTCYGCGDNPDLIKINYGPAYNKFYYSGTEIWITNTRDANTQEITSSYVQFQTSFVTAVTNPQLDLQFAITVHSRFNKSVSTTLFPAFNFSYPVDIDVDAPVIQLLEGDGCQTIGKRALNCPTDGMHNGSVARLELWGNNFPMDPMGSNNMSVSVTIDGVQCRDVKWNVTENNMGMRNVRCQFGSGVSAYGTEGYSYVQISYSSNTENRISQAVRYFNYSDPDITGLYGCNGLDSTDKHTKNCSRIGGGSDKLKITGTNFGKSGARVYIGGQLAPSVEHDADNPHSLLWVTYDVGSRTDEKVLVMNARGGTTTTDAYVSYEQCPLGYSEKSEEEKNNPENKENEGWLCMLCPAGTYTDTLNSEKCNPCDAGEYAPNNGSSTCLPAPMGSIAPNWGSNATQPCPAGTYAPSAGLTECTECTAATFNTKAGSSECWPCNDNSHNNKAERFNCLCDQGFYRYADSVVSDPNSAEVVVAPQCMECSEGMVCNKPGMNWNEIYPKKGYMPMINTEPETLEMMTCINTACEGCEAMDNTCQDKLCTKGFTGVLCTDCAEGLGKTAGYGCETCLEPAVNFVRLLGVMIAVCIIIVLFIRSTIKSALTAKSDISTIGKIGFSFLQFNSMALQFDYEFPKAVQMFLTIQEQPATVANGVLSVDCFVKSGSSSFSSLYVKAICYLMVPWVICGVCTVVFCKYWRMGSTGLKVDMEIKRRRSSLGMLTRMELPEKSKARAYVNAWSRYITAVIITVFLVHPNIVQMTFALLNCKKLGAYDDDNYIIEDMQTKCWVGGHLTMVLLVAIPMLVLYVFGLPLLVLYRLYQNRDELTKDFVNVNPNVIDRYHFLIKGYEPEFYYWEIVIMIRKILMVTIAVFFSYDIQIQSLLATLLCVMALCVHALACPYVTDAMDGLELLSLFGSFCTYFFGQFLFTPSVSSAGRLIVSFIIVIVNMAVMGAIFAMVIGQGMGIVGNFGRKMRNICCCQRNKNKKAIAKPDQTDGTFGDEQPNNVVGYAPAVQAQEQKQDIEFAYNASGRGKRKKKARLRADDPYGNIDYGNIDYSQSNEVEQSHPSKDIQLQSNLIGHPIPIQENDVAMENKISVIENNQFEYEYHGDSNMEDDHQLI